MDTPALDISLYHANAVNGIAEFFGEEVESVSCYAVFEDRIPVKAITLELESATPSDVDDLGTDQWHAEFRFCAYVFVSVFEENAHIKVRNLAVRLASHLYGKRMGCACSAARIIGVNPDSLVLPGTKGRKGEAEDYEVFRVEWSTEGFVGGPSPWGETGDAPVEVWTNNDGESINLLEE